MKRSSSLLLILVVALVSCKEKKQEVREHIPPPAEAVSVVLPTQSVAQLEASAAAGDARAAAILGIKYREGDGVAVDAQKSFSFTKAAAENQNPLGLYAMAAAYTTGTGIEKDETKGAEFATKSISGLQELALNNDGWAQLFLGFAYNDGTGVAKDEKKALDWFEKAAAQGLAIAQTSLGAATEDAQKSIALHEKAAAQGNAAAFVNLGEAFADGYGVSKNEKRATDYFQKAADQGDARGQHRLGNMYSSGTGVALDKRKAVEWYMRSADQGFADAQNSLGVMYSSGIGVAEDKKKAFEWYEKAAMQGLALAQFNLGVAYETGGGTDKDDGKAADWYEKAALQGDDLAQISLAICYKEGLGRSKDEGKAFEWLQKAADQGNADAEWSLGVMYRNGLGVTKDEKKAADWIDKAASHGNSNAQKHLSTKTPAGHEPKPARKGMMDYLVIIEGDAAKGSGSIIRIGNTSLIITNAHVLSGNKKVNFSLLDSTVLSVGDIGIARKYDLALIGVDFNKGGLNVMDKVDKNVSLGDEVMVLGNSEGSGVVTEIPGKVTGIGPELIEVDAKFVAGNSGSPIIHMKTGQVIGIATYAVIPKLDRLTKDSKFSEIRRFGYRIDTVPEWQYPLWDVFQQEAKTIAGIERKSQELIALLRDIYAGGGLNGKLNSGNDNILTKYIAPYLQVRDAPASPRPSPRPVLANDVDAQLGGQAIPGETYDQFWQRRAKLGTQGLLGPQRLAHNENERAEDRRQADAQRLRLAREMKQEAEEKARAEAEAYEQSERARALARQKAAKETFLRGLAYEATSDTKMLKLDTFTDYHRKKLTGEIQLRETLQREFQKLINIQDSGRAITLP